MNEVSETNEMKLVSETNEVNEMNEMNDLLPGGAWQARTEEATSSFSCKTA